MENFINYEKVYTKEQEQLISQEFNRTKGFCCLDHIGATLYSERQIQNVLSELSRELFANPHARNQSSKNTEDAIDIARYMILKHFNTNGDEYSVIFTSGATGALKLIAEHFDFEAEGVLAYLQNNHTSVLGMRYYAKKYIEINDNDAFEHLSKKNCNNKTKNSSNCLFVYPAMSNFCGTKYPLEWIENVQNGALNNLTNQNSKNWYVVLDCASYCATNNLDLSKYKPDFVPISFYKMFGYPSGLGALLVRKSAEKLLKSKYLGGGTVFMALSSDNVMIPRTSIHERFEAGTLPFLSIVSIKHGFDTINRLNLNFDLISEHTFSLAKYVYKKLLLLHHSNGEPVAILYNQTAFKNIKHQGGVVNFNLFRPNGDYVGYSEVLHFANLYGISLRTGCFCNPGACSKYLQLTAEDVTRHFDAGHVCGDQHDLVDGFPTGSVRISFGYMSTKSDADNFLNMIEHCFVIKPIRKIPTKWEFIEKMFYELFISNKRHDQILSANRILPSNKEEALRIEKVEGAGNLEKIFLFPIKSCGAFSVDDKWELTSTGLKYDRQWMIINSAGICVTQKAIKKLCVIKPIIDLEKEVLTLQYKGFPSIQIPLKAAQTNQHNASLCQSKVCGDRIQGWDCGNEVAAWLSNVLKTPDLSLLQIYTEDEEIVGRFSKKENAPQLSLANEAQYLLLNYASIKWLKSKIPKGEFNDSVDDIVLRFRANFVVDFGEPFVENKYQEYTINQIKFKSGGKCTRCQMICIDQSTGETSKEPLSTLSREFQGKICFGVYLNQDCMECDETRFISVDSKVKGYCE